MKPNIYQPERWTEAEFHDLFMVHANFLMKKRNRKAGKIKTIKK